MRQWICSACKVSFTTARLSVDDDLHFFPLSPTDADTQQNGVDYFKNLIFSARPNVNATFSLLFRLGRRRHENLFCEFFDSLCETFISGSLRGSDTKKKLLKSISRRLSAFEYCALLKSHKFRRRSLSAQANYEQEEKKFVCDFLT